MFDYKVAELTWENGQLAIQGLGPPRPSSSPKHTWEKPRAGGTLESIVDHATCLPPHKGDDGLLPPWFKLNRHPSATANDALVPCSKPTHSVDDDDDTRVPDPHPTRGAFSTCERGEGSAARKRRRVAVGDEGSASRHVRKETCETDLEASFGSHEPTSLGKTLSSRTRTTTRDDRDSICHSTPQKREEDSEDGNKRKMERFCNSTNRSRTAAVHNQSERKRRDRINQRMKTLQQLVPNSSKTDKASMLDEAIQYLKQLQAQVQMMSKMSSLSLLQLMMPTPMHQLQMSMMAQMGMMGAMDMNRINRTSQVAPAVPPMLHPAAFFPLTAGWGSGDRLMPPPGSFLAHPPSTAFLACQAQPHNLDAYGRMAALYQQLYQSIGVAPPISKT